MLPRKPLQPQLQMKVDELFLHWLRDSDTQCTLHEDGLLFTQVETLDPTTSETPPCEPRLLDP